MTHLILFLVFGLGMLAALNLLVGRKTPPLAVGSAQVLMDARRALNTLQSALLPQEFVSRIFAQEDFEYLLSAAPPGIQQRFFRERRTIALSWVSRIRSQIFSLMNFHRTHSRFYERLSVPVELTLAMNFFVLRVCCRALQVAILLRGPYAARAMARRTAAAASVLCDLTGESLAFLNPAPTAKLRSTSAGGGITL